MKTRNLTFLLLIFLSTQCRKAEVIKDHQLVVKWAEMALFITQNTPGNTPTYASRCFGYIGLTMYESVVHQDPSYNSLAGQLNGLDSLPKPTGAYHWPAVFNAAQAAILKQIYSQTDSVNISKIDSLESHIVNIFISQNIDNKLLNKSSTFGKSMATAIFEWSKTDGGHRGYLKNFDKSIKFPPKPGGWKPPLYGQSFSHYPLHPHWGKNRTFLKQNDLVSDPSIISFDSTKGSAYYNQFMEVYEQEKKLTLDQKQAAVWWGDDPDQTFTPPGHSFYIATIVLNSKQPKLVACTETFAKLGLSLADSFRNCWKWKYKFFTERPNTFVMEHIDPRWESFWPDPPFPAFPSGHAIQGGAMATVLTATYGTDFKFVDKAHQNRPPDGLRNVMFTPRTYQSFWEAANEIAASRFWGGIHIRQDNEVGISKGKEIAQNVLGLKWKK